MLKDAWADVPSGLLQNVWSKIHDWDKDDYTDEDSVPLSTLQTSTDYCVNILNDVQALVNQIAPTTEQQKSKNGMVTRPMMLNWMPKFQIRIRNQKVKLRL